MSIRTVYKYPVPTEDVFELSLPVGAEILTVQAQYNAPCIWALVDPQEPTNELRRFRLAGTGQAISERTSTLAYLGTFQLHGGSLVFHLFEIEVEAV